MGNNVMLSAAVCVSAVLFLSFTGLTADTHLTQTGKEIFETKCVGCHGTDGTKGRWGAKNLKASALRDADVFRIISNGKRIMPAWKKTLSEDEILLVKEYIKTLRK